MADFKQTICVMVGIPGSGKSTMAQKIKGALWHCPQIISSDEIRAEFLGSEYDQTQNSKVFDIFYQRLREAVGCGFDVILDATNTTLKTRARIFKEFERCKVSRGDVDIIAYVVNTPIEEVFKRNESRQRIVPREVINRFMMGYQHPQTFEGFDRVVLDWVRPQGKDFNTNAFDKVWAQMKNFDQKNPHHIYTLQEHCVKLATLYKPEQGIERSAALLHDVGKLFTQTFDENGIAHYYGHDGVGAYYLTSHPDCLLLGADREAIQEALFYVNYHMRAHNDFKGVHAEPKYRKLFGDERYERLMQFGEYDKMASGTYDIHDKVKETLSNNNN